MDISLSQPNEKILSYVSTGIIDEILVNIILVYHEARKACLYYNIVLNPNIFQLIQDLGLSIINDDDYFYIIKDKSLVVPTNHREIGKLLGYINWNDLNWNNYKVDRYMYKMRAINNEGCSNEFYAEVGSKLKKDDFLIKCNEFGRILKLYNIDTCCYIEKMNKNVIDLRDKMCNVCYNQTSSDIFMGLVIGLVITSGFLILKNRNLIV